MSRSAHIPSPVLTFILLSAIGTTLAAQEPGSPGQYDAERGREGERVRHRTTFTDEQIEGPPLPQFVSIRFELDSTEAAGYRQVYDSFMVATKPQRDSAQATRGKHPHGGGGGYAPGGEATTDPAALSAEWDRLESLGNRLNKQQSQFDKRVKSIFTSAHYKDYKQWRDDQRKQAEEQERQSRPPAPPS